MIGEIVSHYRIDAEIGRGGMGVVYLAEDTRLHCKRALKFLHATVTPDSPNHVRLVNEARALATLEHHNICPVQEIGEHNGQTFIVMSYLEGRTLKDRMAEGPVPLAEALEISRQISAGLAAAHAKGIVHRDVKPDNVMLTEANGETGGPLRAVLMDFGIAKSRDTTLVTRTGTVMGTAAYMSPEQAKGEPVEAASDVWAVGVMLYEMLAGKRPFQGDIEPALLYAIVNVDPEPLVGADQKIPESVERVIGKALAKDRVSRYADAADLLVDLDRAAAGEAVKGRRLERRRRGPIVVAATAVMGLAMVALFVWPGFLSTTDAISVLAVMPLEDRSGEANQAYFSEGIADELAAGLSKIGALTIISRNSALQAKELYDSNREIGAKLGVDALIEGSIQRVGDRVKVSVQLVATDDDRLLWSDSYTRDMKDILNLQSEIALAVSSALKTELTPGEQEDLARDREITPEAFKEILLGRHYTSMATAKSTLQAREHFERALAIEPDLALVHVELVSMFHLNQQMAGLSPSAVAEKVRFHTRRAQELDPESADTYAAMALVAWHYDWDLPAAGKYFLRARELDPNMSMMDYAQYLNIIGRHQDALTQALHAATVDPLDSFMQANLAWRYNLAGKPEEALAEYARLQERDPEFWVGYWGHGLVLIDQGDPEAAVESLQKAVMYSEDALPAKPNYAYSLILAGRQDEAEAILEDLEKQAEEGYVAPYYLGVLYAAFGRNDEAFAAFDRAIEERDWLMFWLFPKNDPNIRGLVSDPRWPELVKKVGFSVV